ncbi:uncharacterized protein [Nicotiana sylvestris]|uniref:Craniofacial development protein 2-like n=1 Tax=Nicotiana sylvestris TaxID=4096 RepID=A0A1U7WQ31_NICSY|nr:PREDICTED: craniofacial development protein 2-like [Nicotiana sylvestris]
MGGTKARDVNGYKLWYSRGVGSKNGVGILIDRDLRELVVNVRMVNDRLLIIKLVVNGFTFNAISAYAPQARLSRESKEVFIGDYFRETARGYNKVHGRFGFGVRNEGSTSLLDFANIFDLVLANKGFQKREGHLVTFQSRVAMTQIDYLLLGKGDKGLCTDYKVIPSE